MNVLEFRRHYPRGGKGKQTAAVALNVAKQICEALEVAHERGVIHRDLKPANIKIIPDGKVKVLDFGLAKIHQSAATSHLSNSPTLMTAPTSGVILGTAAYMSPEQANGKEADRSTDVWAFGCVLYEMLTAHRVFEGDTVGEVLGGIFKSEPDGPKITFRYTDLTYPPGCVPSNRASFKSRYRKSTATLIRVHIA